MKSVIALLMAWCGTQAYAGPTVNPNVTPNDPLPTMVLSCGGAIITTFSPKVEADLIHGTICLIRFGAAHLNVLRA